MKKYIFFLMGAVCFLLSSSAVHANELNKSDANIIGHVLDKNTEEHLSFISVSLKGTTIGTMTDASGHYFLKNLPEGEFTMEVSAVGYKTVSRKVTLRKGKTLEENFEIEEDLIALDGVVVSANRSETTRRMAPTLVNVMDVKVFENTNSSSAHHLYTLNHIGRYLFQSIYTGQGTEYRTRVNQYLRIRAIQPIDTYLLETTVLTIILDPHSGLKIQSL